MLLTSRWRVAVATSACRPAVSLVCRSWWAAFRQTVLQAPGLHLAVRPLLSSNQAAALNAFLASQGAQSIYGANPGTYGHSVASVRPDLASLDDACLRRLAKRGLVMQLAVPVPEGAALAGVQAYNTPAVSDAVGLVPAWPRGRFPRTLFGLWVRPTGEALLQSATEQGKLPRPPLPAFCLLLLGVPRAARHSASPSAGVAILLRLGPLLQLVGHSEMHVNQRVLVRPCYQEGHWVQLTYADLVRASCSRLHGACPTSSSPTCSPSSSPNTACCHTLCAGSTAVRPQRRSCAAGGPSGRSPGPAILVPAEPSALQPGHWLASHAARYCCARSAAHPWPECTRVPLEKPWRTALAGLRYRHVSGGAPAAARNG